MRPTDANSAVDPRPGIVGDIALGIYGNSGKTGSVNTAYFNERPKVDIRANHRRGSLATTQNSRTAVLREKRRCHSECYQKPSQCVNSSGNLPLFVTKPKSDVIIRRLSSLTAASKTSHNHHPDGHSQIDVQITDEAL